MADTPVDTTFGPHLQALLAALSAQPKRPRPEGILAHLLDGKTMAPDVRAFLKTWRDHPANLRIGQFTIADTAIRKAFDQPVWAKDGPGPDDPSHPVDGKVREDLVALGVHAGQGLVVLVHSADAISSEPVTLSKWQEIRSAGSLEELLAHHHALALAEGLPSALSAHLT